MSLKENGLPKDRNYLECGLPDFLQDSIRAMKDAWGKLDRGIEYLRWDCDYCNLQSDINSAEVNQLISEEQIAIDRKVLTERFWDMFIVDALIGNWRFSIMLNGKKIKYFDFISSL